jgi:hypothetical protein
MKRNVKDRGHGYMKAYNYEDSIKLNNLYADLRDNNKLIAEFMGGIKSSVPNLINLPQTIGQSSILCVKGSEGLPSSTYKVERINELQYDSSWDWLMPVVVKLFDNEYNEFDGADDLMFRLNDAIMETNLDSLHRIVVEFINEYNKTI